MMFDEKQIRNNKLKTYRAGHDYIHRKLAGEDVLICVKGGIADLSRTITLNASALCLWDMLNEYCTFEDMVKALIKVFEIDRKSAEDGVVGFLQILWEHDMVESAENCERRGEEKCGQS